MSCFPPLTHLLVPETGNLKSADGVHGSHLPPVKKQKFSLKKTNIFIWKYIHNEGPVQAGLISLVNNTKSTSQQPENVCLGRFIAPSCECENKKKRIGQDNGWMEVTRGAN